MRDQDVPAAARALRAKLLFARMGGETKRFHTQQVLRENTVAQHSHGVAMLCWMITDGNASSNLLMAALSHDLAEQQMGDLPAPAKRKHPFLKQFDAVENDVLIEAGFGFSLTTCEQNTLKIADCLDGLLYLWRERTLGNKALQGVFNNFLMYAEGRIQLRTPAAYILGEILQLWKEANQ